jgi:hypothetical protein
MTKPPTVFLSYAFDDKATAKRIAVELIKAGIRTWFAGWEMKPGDSMRRRMEQGLADCSHFVVLLSPNSINRPWVNEEIDAAFTLTLEEKTKLVGLLYGVTPKDLSIMMRSRIMESIADATFDRDVIQLVERLYGVTDKPALGSPAFELPVVIAPDTGLSPAASAITKMMVLESEHGLDQDPRYSMEEAIAALSLSAEAMEDGARDLVESSCAYYTDAPGGIFIGSRVRLFSDFDAYWQPWTPQEDAILIAQHLQHLGVNQGIVVPEFAAEHGWSARRINPALTILADHDAALLGVSTVDPWRFYSLGCTGETRRFLRSTAGS